MAKYIHKISKEEYDSFNKQYIVYALKDMSYGYAFCQHFKITDFLLIFSYKEKTVFSENYIKNTYIK